MEHHLRIAEGVTHFLENRFTLFGFKFGVEPLLGLLPWIGDAVAFVLSLYLIWIAMQLRLPDDKIRQMIRNIVLDFALGLVPVVGTVGDFFFRANARNYKILKEHVTVSEAVVLHA